MNLAPELPQSIPGPSYTLGAQETPPVEPLPPHQLQDLAERISIILKDRGSPQSQEEVWPSCCPTPFWFGQRYFPASTGEAVLTKKQWVWPENG
uniref:Uncharacterized protein n=1 Tax=Magallana gigas TaxID=29159 RepID=K1Q7D0_MAGGI